MVDVFTALANALMGWVGGTPSSSCFTGQDCGSAGFILGLILFVCLAAFLVWLIGLQHAHGWGLVMAFGIPAVFDFMVGWWPLWGLIALGIFAAVVISRGGGVAPGGM